MWLAILIIAIAIGIGIVAGVSNAKKTNQMAREGIIIQRPASFWENKELFTTNATYNQVKAQIKSNSFEGCHVSISYNINGNQSISFHSGTYNAMLDCLETNGEKNKFRFYFTTWDTRHNIPYGREQMNALMTTIEKIFLSLDPATTVENRRMEVSTKTKFF